MKSISIQFFALPDELARMVETWREELDFFLVAMKLVPGKQAYSIENLMNFAGQPTSEIISVFLGHKPPILDVEDKYDFIGQNSDYVFVDFGKCDSKGLEQSWFGGKTDDLALLAEWRKLARQLRSMSKAGLWAFNTEFGGKHFYKDIRYTTGSEQFCRDGGKLLSDGPFVVFELDSSLH